jgi:hypothetical protein
MTMPELQGPDLGPGPPYGDAHPRERQTYRGLRRWGSLPGWYGVLIVFGGAALGLCITLVARRDPGNPLGACVLAGTLVAVLAVRPRASYLIIPVPALAYVVAASVAGLVHDRAADATSRTALAVNGIQWIAAGFLAMAAATVLAIVVTAARWPRRGRRGHRHEPIQIPPAQESDYPASASSWSAHNAGPDA